MIAVEVSSRPVFVRIIRATNAAFRLSYAVLGIGPKSVTQQAKDGKSRSLAKAIGFVLVLAS